MNTFRIRAHYPRVPGELVLRTELDWNIDVEGTTMGTPGSEFVVQAAQPWLYFKVCLRTASGLVWQPGMDRVAEPHPGGRDIYPFFRAGLAGTLSDLRAIDGVPFRVYLPAGYDENTLKKYPVLYMHDGANLFLPEESFQQAEWQVDETLDTLHALNVIDQCVVVGIYAQDRFVQYTAPGYLPYATWCTDVLRPWVDSEFRTLKGPQHTAVLGSSLGGVLALHTTWSRPDVFGMAGCLSSTFGVFDDLFQRVGSEERPQNIRLYLDSGWPRDNFERTIAMRDLLLRRGFEQGRDLLHLVYVGEQHQEASWRSRIHVPFQWFFARPPASV